MKRLVMIFTTILAVSAYSQDVQKMIQRVEKDGVKPDNSRYYMYEDKMIEFFKAYNWQDEVVSMKEIWVERPDLQSYYWAQIKTKNSGGAFYVHYDPYWQQAGGSMLAVEPNLWPSNFKKHVDDLNAKLEAEEKARQEERIKVEKLAMESALNEAEKLDVQLLEKELAEVEKLMIEQGLEKIYDADGNSYRVVKIGNQIWMAENLKTTKYSEGSKIPNVTNNSEWLNLKSGAYCWYQNDSIKNKHRWGALYNYYTIADERNVCPSGWHVPTKVEWETLINFLGGMTYGGGKMYTAYRNGYLIQGLDNSSHFTAIMGGGQFPGGFSDLKSYAYYGTSTSFNESDSYAIVLEYNNTSLGLQNGSKTFGISVRCIKD